MALRRPVFFATSILSVILFGCSGADDGRRELSGTVEFKGKPLDQGTIQFHPEGDGTFGGAPIENGKFSIDRKQGLKVGTYRVVISSGMPGKAAAEAAPGESGPPAKERIPASWNVNSKQTVKVADSGPNVFEFKIP